MSTRCCVGLREVLPAGVKVTVVADRGFADCKQFYALTTELAFEYVIRLRGDIYVTNARGERRPAAGWVGAGGRARRLVGARVTDAYELPVGVVVCAHDPKMDEPWCLVASEATVPTRVLIRYYGKRWGIEAGFRSASHRMPPSCVQNQAPSRRWSRLVALVVGTRSLSVVHAHRCWIRLKITDLQPKADLPPAWLYYILACSDQAANRFRPESVIGLRRNPHLPLAICSSLARLGLELADWNTCEREGQ